MPDYSGDTYRDINEGLISNVSAALNAWQDVELGKEMALILYRDIQRLDVDGDRDRNYGRTRKDTGVVVMNTRVVQLMKCTNS